MEQSLFLLLALLIASSRIEARIDDLGAIQMLDQRMGKVEDEDDEVQFFPWLQSDGIGRTLVNVDSLGAVGDGITDDTEAFVQAWKVACNTSNAVLLVPEGKTYLVKAARFRGPCAGDLIVQEQCSCSKKLNLIANEVSSYRNQMQIKSCCNGVFREVESREIVAPDEPNDWDPNSPRTWLFFSGLRGVIFQGGGLINGSGHNWWASSCKIDKTKVIASHLFQAFTIDSSSAVWVSSLNFKDSQQIHFTVSRSQVVRVSELNVQAPHNSPNTDGIHISDSTNIVIQNSKIGTGSSSLINPSLHPATAFIEDGKLCLLVSGDDCISIVNGTSNIKMKNIMCGPGHGISIGSLGKDNSTAAVIGVVLDNAVLTGTTNGVRIKTWQGGSGYLKGVRFQNVRMNNVSNPIIIDQFYCDSPTPCANQTSAVSVTEVMYINISGTSATPNAIKFACSDTVPCSKIVLANINLRRDDGTENAFCNNAIGFKYGLVIPSADCLLSYDKSYGHDASEKRTNRQIIHTEL
ncbi:putative polygalacturonase [Nymphaea thermarum]|nr:putative polygalacturonase [Nymphaea thermarum]